MSAIIRSRIFKMTGAALRLGVSRNVTSIRSMSHGFPRSYQRYKCENQLKSWERAVGMLGMTAAIMGPTGWFLAHFEEYQIKDDEDEDEA